LRSIKLNFFLNILNITCLILDSGGGLGIRNISFLIIFIYVLKGIYSNYALKKNFLILYVFFLISLSPAVIISILNSVPISVIFKWLFSFLVIPFLYVYIKTSNLSVKCFVYSGVIFSSIIIMLFFGRLYNLSIISLFNEYISSHSDGFFGNKTFLNGIVLPNVYFQGTLSLVICGSLCLKYKNYFIFFLIIFSLILAPSRFGFMILLLWALFILFRKSLFRITLLLPILMFIFYFSFKDLAFGYEIISAFTGESDALAIRNGHFISIVDIFRDNPFYLFFGQGPGSVFFTKGTYIFTDNIEISQLEFIRKYGFISFLNFCVFYFFPLLGKSNSDIYLKGSLVMYFLVSFSNPVLFSLFSMLFLAFVYVEIFDNKLTVHDI